MGAPVSELGYISATTRKRTTKSIWTRGGIGEEKKFSDADEHFDSSYPVGETPSIGCLLRLDYRYIGSYISV
jgi:hypothetical protein